MVEKIVMRRSGMQEFAGQMRRAHGFESLIPPACLLQPSQLIDDWQDKILLLDRNNPEGLRTNLYLALNEYKKVAAMD